MGILDSAQLTKLLEKLSIFGLNPEEWVLADQESNFLSKLLLVNKHDPHFKLIGQVNQKGWQQLEILSI